MLGFVFITPYAFLDPFTLQALADLCDIAGVVIDHTCDFGGWHNEPVAHVLNASLSVLLHGLELHETWLDPVHGIGNTILLNIPFKAMISRRHCHSTLGNNLARLKARNEA